LCLVEYLPGPPDFGRDFVSLGGAEKGSWGRQRIRPSAKGDEGQQAAEIAEEDIGNALAKRRKVFRAGSGFSRLRAADGRGGE
jgi:hypothetical protein